MLFECLLQALKRITLSKSLHVQLSTPHGRQLSLNSRRSAIDSCAIFRWKSTRSASCAAPDVQRSHPGRTISDSCETRRTIGRCTQRRVSSFNRSSPLHSTGTAIGGALRSWWHSADRIIRRKGILRACRMLVTQKTCGLICTQRFLWDRADGSQSHPEDRRDLVWFDTGAPRMLGVFFEKDCGVDSLPVVRDAQIELRSIE